MRQSTSSFPSSPRGRNGPFTSLSSLKNAFILFIAAMVVVLVNFHPQKQDDFQDLPPAQTSNDYSKSVGESSFFDEVLALTYKRAISTKKTVRRPHQLIDGWNRTNGGLDDDDRKTLFEIYYNASSVFEWGLGESTLIAAKVGVPRYTGVDSDPEWVEASRNNTKKLYGMSHFRFLYADIGDLKNYGNPADNTLEKIQYNYQVAPLAGELKPFDVYMVDGRYRVACACMAFLHALKLGADMEKVRVLVHDNNFVSKGYQKLGELGEAVVKNKRLWVYKLRNDTTQEMIFNMWNDFERRQE